MAAFRPCQGEIRPLPAAAKEKGVPAGLLRDFTADGQPDGEERGRVRSVLMALGKAPLRSTRATFSLFSVFIGG